MFSLTALPPFPYSHFPEAGSMLFHRFIVPGVARESLSSLLTAKGYGRKMY